jgi:hypothetical protein
MPAKHLDVFLILALLARNTNIAGFWNKPISCRNNSIFVFRQPGPGRQKSFNDQEIEYICRNGSIISYLFTWLALPGVR